MIRTINSALFFLAAGIFTSVTILSAYQILFIIPCFYFTYKNMKDGTFHLPKSSWVLVALIIWSLFGLLLNFESIPKPLTNFGKVKYFYYGLGGVFVFRYWLKYSSESVMRNIIHLFFLAIIVPGLYSMIEVFILDKYRANGLTDTMRYGYGSAMILLTLFSAILHHHKIPQLFNKKYAVLTFIIGFVAMYLTYTRGGLLGFLCGLPFALYYYKKKLGLIFGGASLIILLSLGSVYLLGKSKQENQNQNQSRYLMNKNNSSDKIRRSQWIAAMIATKEKPLYGWGLSNFSSQIKRIKIENNLYAQEYVSHAHNLFLEFAAGTGIVGLLLFTSWIFLWALEVFQQGGLVRALIIPFGVAFVTSSQFEVTFDANNASMIFTLYALSVVNVGSSHSKKSLSTEKS